MSNQREIAKRELDLSFVPSLDLRNNELKLFDHEIYLRMNYYLRFNEILHSYEAFRSSVDEITGIEGGDWEEVNLDELHNDLLRASVTYKFKKITDREFDLMLSDRRVIPAYNPFVAYFNGLPLVPKGVTTHIDALANFVKIDGGIEEQKRWVTNFKKSLVRTVKCALVDNYFNKQCLVLFSDDQSRGKTSFSRALCPQKLKRYFYEEMINPSDKDSLVTIGNNFLILLDELASFTRTDINQLKAVLSKSGVKVRLPYAKRPINFPRRASFFATTNRTDFLVDKENVRWVVFNVKEIDFSYGNPLTGDMNIDIDLVWAEAFGLMQDKNFMAELTKEDLELNETNNDLYSAGSIEKELIQQYFLPTVPEDRDKSGFYSLQPMRVLELLLKLLSEDDREDIKHLVTEKKFYYALSNEIKGWRKRSFRDDGDRSVAGYHFFVRKEMKSNELF